MFKLVSKNKKIDLNRFIKTMCGCCRHECSELCPTDVLEVSGYDATRSVIAPY